MVLTYEFWDVSEIVDQLDSLLRVLERKHFYMMNDPTFEDEAGQKIGPGDLIAMESRIRALRTKRDLLKVNI